MNNRNYRRQKKKGTEEIFETAMSDNLPKLISDPKPQIQETQRIAGRIDGRQGWVDTTHRHTIFKLQKIRDEEKNPGNS